MSDLKSEDADAGRTEEEEPQDGGSSPDTPPKPPTAVDLLVVIDNSGSMSDEQVKFAAVLDGFVGALASGSVKSRIDGETRTFSPVESLHIGIVSTDMGVNGAPPQKSCGALSFSPTERETATTQTFLIKPRGDDGLLLTSTEVAQAGVWASTGPGTEPQQLVAPDPSCADVELPQGQRYIDYRAGESDAVATARAFSCLAKLGKNGCGLEQQLEAGLKALTPADSKLRFSEDTLGQGDSETSRVKAGPNAGFLREDAVLVVVFVSDEEDCSIPDASRAIFDVNDTSIAGTINVRCGLPSNQGRLHPISRYVDGLRALKPAAYQDRIIVTSVVGVPRASTTDVDVYSGAAAIQELLERDDMQFQTRANPVTGNDEPLPTCLSDNGGGSAPGRRFLELSKAFGDNGLVTSICESSYGPVLEVLAEKIGTLLQGEPLN
ncbi:MAG TPA: hypothetical protein VFZ61_01400 [Polyangiales bacterium]